MSRGYMLWKQKLPWILDGMHSGKRQVLIAALSREPRTELDVFELAVLGLRMDSDHSPEKKMQMISQVS